MANLEEKTRQIETLQCQRKISELIPQAPTHNEKKRLYSDAVIGNQQKTAEKHSSRPLRAKVATSLNI
jgi:hypothetical protein